MISALHSTLILKDCPVQASNTRKHKGGGGCGCLQSRSQSTAGWAFTNQSQYGSWLVFAWMPLYWQHNKHNAKDIEEQQSCIGNVFSKSGSLRTFFHRGNHLLSGQWVGIPSMASICVCSFCAASQVQAADPNSSQNSIWADVKANFFPLCVPILMSKKPFRLPCKQRPVCKPTITLNVRKKSLLPAPFFLLISHISSVYMHWGGLIQVISVEGACGVSHKHHLNHKHPWSSQLPRCVALCTDAESRWILIHMTTQRWVENVSTSSKQSEAQCRPLLLPCGNMSLRKSCSRWSPSPIYQVGSKHPANASKLAEVFCKASKQR